MNCDFVFVCHCPSMQFSADVQVDLSGQAVVFRDFQNRASPNVRFSAVVQRYSLANFRNPAFTNFRILRSPLSTCQT